VKPSLHRPVVLLAVIWLVAGDATAQPQFDRWTTENGLPQNTINDIVQTRDGYLWLATFGGLVRFDGLRFVVFDTEIEGIRSQRVRALREDSEGTLWAGTEDGMLLRYQGGRFTTYDASPGLPRTEALRIDEDSGRNLWITWAGGVVTKFDRTRFVNYRPGDLEHRVAPHDRFLPQLQTGYEGGHDVWWSQDAAGLHCLVNGQVRTLMVGRDLPDGSKVTAVLTDGAGKLLVHTSNAGIVQVTWDRTTRHRARQLPVAVVPGAFVEGRNGDLWFSAGLQDLYRIADGQLEKRATLPQTIFSVYEDREKSIWAGTQHGLYRMRDVTVTTHAERDGLSSNLVFSILRTRRGAVWIGTWGGGLTRIESGRLKTYGPADGLPSNLVTAIHEDGSERLWVGTTSGVSYLEDGRFRTYHEGRGLLKGNTWAIHRDRAGRLWFATDRGLIRVQHDEVTRYTTADGLSHDRVAALFEDRAGALWIGTYRGLTRFKDGVFTTFTGRDGLVGNQVRAIYEDGDGVLWLGTSDSGLYRLKDGRLTRYTKKQGLYDNGVFQILEDDSGHFWIGCNRGIYRVSRRDLNEVADGAKASVTTVALGTKDGLESVEANGGRQPAGMKAPDGRLWFPTMGGVVVIDPKAVRLNTSAPPVVIEEVRRGGETVDFAAGLEVPAGTSAFEIRYTAPSFVDPEQIAFRYRLDGLDEDWIDARDRRVAVYHRVPPGRYRFTVIAANNDGVWNTNGAGVDIIVFPPLWQTWWFLTLASAGSVAMLAFAYQRRVARLHREHGRQQAFSRQLIDSLEHERGRISTDMHDVLGQDLTIIKTRARLTSEKLAGNDPAQEELHEIGLLAEKTSAELREIAYDLRPYHLDKVGLSATIDGMIRRVGRTCEIAFATDIANIDDCFRREAGIHVFRIAQEAVSNIVKHSRARQARVTIRRAGGRVEMRIEDDGQGLTNGNGADGARRTFGVMGMMERARLAGGDADVAPRPGGGTAVTARFRIEDS